MVQDDQYLLNCLQYMELNPVRAGIVKDPGDYTWSSYKSHAFGKNIGMWTPHPLYLGLGSTHKSRQNFYREIINEALTIEAIAKIRHCANTGLVLGTEKFRDQVESMRA
jgi:putative transposase